MLGNAAERQRQAVEALEAASRAGQGSAVDIMLSLLAPQEEAVLRYRYGLGRVRLRTLREIGEAIGLSGGRVSQIEHKARRRVGWFVHVVGPIGSPAIEHYAATKRAERDEAERLARAELERQTAERAHRRQDKADRDEARRAKARQKAWQRRLDRAIADRDELAGRMLRLTVRIAGIERRGWWARLILPRDAVLLRLRTEQALLDAQIKEADDVVIRLRASGPP